jgi:hypothetical protein
MAYCMPLISVTAIRMNPALTFASESASRAVVDASWAVAAVTFLVSCAFVVVNDAVKAAIYTQQHAQVS